MHLLAAQAGAIQQDGEAIDLGQTPGDIVFASSADSELALLAGAADRAAWDGLRLANLLRLGHNLSVDLWLDNTVRHARLVVLRLLGGPAYWPYGVDELTALARGGKIRLALLPGDTTPDPILRDRSTLPPADWDRLFTLLATGGMEAADLALATMRAISEGGESPSPPAGVDPRPSPSPTLPTSGRVFVRASGIAWRQTQPGTLPLVGRVGEGEAADSAPETAFPAGDALPRFGLWPTPAPDPSPQGGGEQGEPVTGQPNRRSARLRNIDRARALRLNATPPERRLWRILREFAPLGYHFRRQVPIGPYYADFATHHPKLVIEADGETHASTAGQRHDQTRDAFLQSLGYRMLRISNRDVSKNPKGVHHLIEAALLAAAEATSPPSPLRGGVGGGGGPQALAYRSPSSPSPLKGGTKRGGRLQAQPSLDPAHPLVPVLFYRALLEGAGTAAVESLVAALEAAGLTPLPLFVSSLKEPEAVAYVQVTFAANPPVVILNLTGFALGLDGLPPEQNPFAGTDAPVIQLVQGGRPAPLWAADPQGLSPKDLAMQVVMPELDGRIGGILVGHKADSVWHARTQCPLTAFAPDADGIARATALAAAWARLRATPRATRRVALVLANYPIRDGRLANGVGYDAPQSTVEMLRTLAEAGYELRTTPTPDSSPQGGGEQGGDAIDSLPLEGREGGSKGGGFLNHRHIRPAKNIARARSLRLDGTPPERQLWYLLRELRPQGFHFRRQVPIGRYFADFASHHPKLVIELDGDTHAGPAAEASDTARSAFLAKAGYHVLRFTNRDVTGNLEGVGRSIVEALEFLATPTPSLPSRGRGELWHDIAPSPPSPLRGGVGGGGSFPTGNPSGNGEINHGESIDSLPLEGREGGSKGGGFFPATGNDLVALLQSGPTNAHPSRPGGIPFPLARYRALFAGLPGKIRAEVTTRWGAPEADPFVRDGSFHLPAIRFGNVAVLLQPARGYDRDEVASYHDPDLVPPHAYLAAYLWPRHEFGAHALIHNGKHGSLEWLPGKANALDAASYPAALWGGLPHLYPFIVNDPGEGTQAKRRTGAVIIDHLVPPLTRAETYGPLKDLEALLDEYYAASGLDRRRLADLRRRILAFTRDARLDEDLALPADEGEALKTIDNFLCELKEAQIRDGLHVFGRSPTGALERDLIVALARVPRGENPGDASLIRALADDLRLGIDPLTARLGDAWTGPADFAGISRTFASQMSPMRTVGDVVEALEELAAGLVEGTVPAPPEWTATRAVLATIESTVRPRLRASGPNEIKALLDGLDGKFVPPGPSGAPSRGRLDVLPTGRNFYSVDNRAVPTPTAWELGRKSAENLLLRHLQDHGNHLKSLALSVWGTANMRTGGDDVAQALAFIGARPVWDPGSLRVSGYEIIPLARLGRPRVDVTLRISGFFRDAFPVQIALFDRAVRAIGALGEPDDQNPIAARMRADALGLIAGGASEAEAAAQAGYRIFGSKPGAYGAGLQGLMDSGKWSGKADLAEAFLNWGQYAYGAKAAGVPERARFAARLSDIEAVVHNQDNREHDLLDSDDYYQFEGGLAVTAETLAGTKPAAYHNDHSRPDRPVTRTLAEEISKVMRSRVVNPKWINGVKRHGYKGAFEIIATVDYMFAFAATTGAVKSHHFDLAFAAFVEDDAVRGFIQDNNRFGYDELLRKFEEARRRGFWTPRSNAAHAYLSETAK